MWSVPAITLATAAPAYAASPTRFVVFWAYNYQWSTSEVPGADISIAYYLEDSTEPGPSPAVIVTVTFPQSWTDGGTRSVSITPNGGGDYGDWVPSVSPVDGVILTNDSVSFVHPGGLNSESTDAENLSFTAVVPGVDLSANTDPIGLSHGLVDPVDNADWGVAAHSAQLINHGVTLD